VDPYFTSNTVEGQDFSKFPVANIIKHKAALTARYLFGLPAAVGDASISATYSWQSYKTGTLDLNFSTTEDPLQGRTPAYGLLNMRADWNHIAGSSFDVSAFCDNVTNKTYLSLVLNSWTLGQDTGQYGPPRMYGASVRWHF
jgi:iron complex outermembrane receptor protein